jgi:hypothetical protein
MVLFIAVIREVENKFNSICKQRNLQRMHNSHFISSLEALLKINLDAFFV